MCLQPDALSTPAALATQISRRSLRSELSKSDFISCNGFHQQSLFFFLSRLTKFSFRPKCQSPPKSARPSLFGVPGSTDREPWIQPGFICIQGPPVYEEGGLFIVQLPIHFIGFLYKTISKNGILLLKMVFLLSRMTLVFPLS